MKISRILRKLIRACVDDQRMLRDESLRVDPRRAATLTRLAGERGTFVADLERLGQVSGRNEGSWLQHSREARRDAWVAASGPNTGDAIASCRHSRARTEAVYARALQTPWPEGILRVIAGQRHRLEGEADELAQLQF